MDSFDGFDKTGLGPNDFVTETLMAAKRNSTAMQRASKEWITKWFKVLD